MNTSDLGRKIQASIMQGMYVSEKVAAFREKRLQEKQRKAVEDSYHVEQDINNRYVKAPNRSNKPMIAKGFPHNQALYDSKRVSPGQVPQQYELSRTESRAFASSHLNAENEYYIQQNESMVSFQNSRLDSTRERIDVLKLSFSTQYDMMSMQAPQPAVKQLNLPARMGSNKQEVL